jgi:heme A synthase
MGILPSGFSDKTVCLSISAFMAVWMYIVLFKRLLKRKHTRDFCKVTCWCNFLIQVNNGILAYSEHAPFLLCWYVAQTAMTAVVLFLVYRYWDYPNPPKNLTTLP